MKKLAIILLVLSMLFLTTSCDILEQFLVTYPLPGGNDGRPGADGGDYEEMTEGDYDELNKLLKTLESNVVVTVETKKAGVLLTSMYVITDEYVKYSVQNFAMLPEDGDIGKLDGGMILHVNGDARFNERGELIDDEGNAVNLPDVEMLGRGMNLDAENFSSAHRSDIEFEGEAISAAKLLGVDTDVQNVTVRIEYHEDKITFMSLSYDKGGADVYVTYDFNRAL